MAENVHASCISWLGKGVLIRGASGSGKSDLALRLIDAGAELVADDVVRLERIDDHIRASSLPTGRGLLELRGQGIYRFPNLDTTRIDLVADLVHGNQLSRLPEESWITLETIALPYCRLVPGAASAVARVRTVLTGEPAG